MRDKSVFQINNSIIVTFTNKQINWLKIVDLLINFTDNHYLSSTTETLKFGVYFKIKP